MRKPADDTLRRSSRLARIAAFNAGFGGLGRILFIGGAVGVAFADWSHDGIAGPAQRRPQGTHPRLRILDLLEQSKSHHMTAEDIYRQLLDKGEDIGLATVYRVLTQFEAAGLVLKSNFGNNQSVYELDRGHHHDHMVDIDSGKIIEFESPEIEELQRKVAAEHGYVIEEHSLVLYVRKKR